MSNVCLNTNVWDLHIHTNQCSKASGDFRGLSDTEYIDKIIAIFEKFPDLDMISFTDHNRINVDVYHEFYRRKLKVKLLPGIEIDVDFGDSNKSKHLIAYFNDQQYDIDTIAKEVNEIMEKFSVTDSKPIPIYQLTKELVERKIQFLYSPHAFKQRPRDISSDWVGGDSNNRASKYTDQFLCFWETAGLKDIENARQFLNDFLDEKEVSIVSFSDSSSFSEISKYLESPPIYFSSLSSFRGVQMVGSDSSRISFVPSKLSHEDKSKYIGRIKFGENDVYLSNKLNTIIGGRGSGKSILLDGIAKEMGMRSDNDDFKERNEYLNGFTINLFDLNNNPITSAYKVDYYDQSYVTKIFTSKDRNKKLENYFSREFDQIDAIDNVSVLSDIKTKFNELLNKNTSITISDNLGNVSSVFKNITDNTLKLKLKRQDTPKNDFISNFDFDRQSTELKKNLIIPKQIVKKDEVKTIIIGFQENIVDEIEKHNKNVLNSTYLLSRIYENFLNYKSSKSSDSKSKESLRKLLNDTFANMFGEYATRYSIVNSIINLEELPYRIVNHQNDMAINIPKFTFTKELIVEHPIEFFVRIFDKYVSGKTYPHKKHISNIEKLFTTYCTDIENFMNDSKSLQEMDKELLELALNVQPKNCIYYNGKNIEKESPGTQTNILMEYIVNSNASIPLLIDQPEDNIDNKAIYNDLTKWISELKYKRQIIMVTHDANIVINADSENLIISDQVRSSEFKYVYGALEYETNIIEASLILDGGTDAVKRRLMKYGK